MHSWRWDQSRQMYYCAVCLVQIPLEVASEAPKPVWHGIHGVWELLNRVAETPCFSARAESTEGAP